MINLDKKGVLLALGERDNDFTHYYLHFSENNKFDYIKLTLEIARLSEKKIKQEIIFNTFYEEFDKNDKSEIIVKNSKKAIRSLNLLMEENVDYFLNKIKNKFNCQIIKLPTKNKTNIFDVNINWLIAKLTSEQDKKNIESNIESNLIKNNLKL